MVETKATNRLYIRRPLLQDAVFIANIENDLDVKRLIGGPSGKSEAQYLNSISRIVQDYRCLTIELKQNGQPIGRCGIIANDLESEIHIVLARPYWGQGYGLEVAMALIELSLKEFPDKKIVAKVHPDNARSIKILKRIGMIQTGIISSVRYDNGFLRFEKTNL